MSAHSTIGVKVYTCWESSSGVRPTSNFTLLSDEITAIPAFDNAPQGIDVTPLSELVSIRRIPGLKGSDSGNLPSLMMAAWCSTPKRS